MSETKESTVIRLSEIPINSIYLAQSRERLLMYEINKVAGLQSEQDLCYS